METMMRSTTMVLMTCAVIMVASLMPVYAQDTGVKAVAAWQGQGRFYKVTETLALFSGYFQGLMEFENKQGELHAATMICPAMVEVNLTDGTQQGWGRCVITPSGGDRVYAGWSCTGTHLDGCAGPFTVSGGTGKFRSIAGESTFVVRSKIAEYVVSAPDGGVTAEFAGQAVWSALRYKMP
jgi:hypothetical protein